MIGVYERKPHWTNKTSFKKGMIPWNKGLKHTQIANSGSFKKGQNANEKHLFWKGDKAGYIAIHNWIRRHYGKATKCVNGHTAKMYVWANISGDYRRDISDFEQLCQSCNLRGGVRINKRFQGKGLLCIVGSI